MVQNRSNGVNTLIDGNYERVVDHLQIVGVGGGSSVASSHRFGNEEPVGASTLLIVTLATVGAAAALSVTK